MGVSWRHKQSTLETPASWSQIVRPIHAAQVGAPGQKRKGCRHEKCAQPVQLRHGLFTGLGCEEVNNDVGFFKLAQRHEQSDGGARCNASEFEVASDGVACGVSTYEAVAGHQGNECEQCTGQNAAQLGQLFKNFQRESPNRKTGGLSHSPSFARPYLAGLTLTVKVPKPATLPTNTSPATTAATPSGVPV